MKLRPNRLKRKLEEGKIAYIASGFASPDEIDAFGPGGIRRCVARR